MPKITPLDPKRPRKIGETVWSERGLSIPLVEKIREAEWPWVIIIASPIVGVVGAIVWRILKLSSPRKRGPSFLV